MHFSIFRDHLYVYVFKRIFYNQQNFILYNSENIGSRQKHNLLYTATYVKLIYKFNIRAIYIEVKFREQHYVIS